MSCNNCENMFKLKVSVKKNLSDNTFNGNGWRNYEQETSYREYSQCIVIGKHLSRSEIKDFCSCTHYRSMT